MLRNEDKTHDAMSDTIIVVVVTRKIGLCPRLLNILCYNKQRLAEVFEKFKLRILQVTNKELWNLRVKYTHDHSCFNTYFNLGSYKAHLQND